MWVNLVILATAQPAGVAVVLATGNRPGTGRDRKCRNTPASEQIPGGIRGRFIRGAVARPRVAKSEGESLSAPMLRARCARDRRSATPGGGLRRTDHPGDAPVSTGARSHTSPSWLSTTALVTTLTVFLAALAAGVWSAVIVSATPVARPFEVPWWVLAMLVAAAEVAVIHLRFSRDAQSFSLSEVVLAFGLLLATPGTLLVSVLVGSAVALFAVRRQRPIKAWFNLAQLALVSGITALTWNALLGGADPLSVRGWAAVTVAAVAGFGVGIVVVSGVIILTGGRLGVRDVAESTVLGAVGATVNSSLGFVAAVTAWSDPWISPLGFLPEVVAYIGYRTYARQRDQNRRLASMHAITESIHTPSDIASGLVAAAEHTRDIIGASWLEISLQSDGDPTQPYRTLVALDETPTTLESVRIAEEQPDWWSRVVERQEAVIVRSATRSGTAGAPEVAREALVVPVVGSERVHGYVLAADPLADVSTFDPSDVQFLETVAKQVAVVLDNGRLTASLARMTEAKHELEDLVRSKNNFIASVSHELRTPLTAIVGLATELEAWLDSLPHTDVKEFIGLIADESNELAYIVEDLLVAARTDIGTLVTTSQQIDVLSALAPVTHNAVSRSGSVPVTVADGCAEIQVDPLRFRQIVRNLLTNAARYGGERIHIDVNDAGRHVAVAVVDDGPGVPERNVDRIFEPYARGEDEPSQPGSLGLGLTVARNLAVLMGGDLIYDRVDGLTRFTALVPRPAESPVTMTARASTKAGRTTT